MAIEIVAIGSEILSGFTINTNASYISKRLFDAGIPTAYHTVVADDAAALKKAFNKALGRSRFVIVTGGLGPTCDDITRSIAAELFHSSMQYSPELAQKLIARYGNKLISVEDQATVPVKAELIENSLGTASGLIFKEENSTFFLLPGVPPEMKKMFDQDVLPRISENYPLEWRVKRRWLHFFHLFESQIDPALREMKAKIPQLEFGIYPSRGNLSVCISMKASEPDLLLEEAYLKLKQDFSDHYFEADSGKIEEAVQKIFVDNGITLSLAESCTGGAMAAKLTSRAGSSEYFLGSLVTYSNRLKQSLLNVPEDVLNSYGAVSREVVELMAQGLIDHAGSDYGVSVSGIAGPGGGTAEKPVGTIWAAIVKKGRKPYSWQLRGFVSSREMVIDYTVNVVLGTLYKIVKGDLIR